MERSDTADPYDGNGATAGYCSRDKLWTAAILAPAARRSSVWLLRLNAPLSQTPAGTSNTARFSASSEEIASNQFCVNHYAGNVVYSTENFVEKNKDSIGDSLKVLSKSTLPFLRETVGKKLGQVKGNFKENCVARKFTKQVKKDEGGSESDGRATNPLLPSSPSCETNWSKPPPTSSGASSLTASCCL